MDILEEENKKARVLVQNELKVKDRKTNQVRNRVELVIVFHRDLK